MIGSHKFLKRQGPGWLLVPEFWNCEGPQRAQTQHLCSNVGLTQSCELRFFPLTRSQHPQKVVPLRGCYFDKLKLQGTVNLCSSVLLFQLDAAETQQKYSVLWTTNIWLRKNNPVEFLCFFVARLQTFSAGACKGNQRRTHQWYKSRELARDSLFLLV